MLPVVNEEIAHSMRHEMMDQGADYMDALIHRIEAENPSIIKFVEGFAGNYDDDLRRHFIACAVGVYRLLEIQSEVDELNATFQ